MRTSRREMLKVSLGGIPLISLASTIPAFLGKFAFAESPTTSPISDDNILVVIQMGGGNDGLNTVVPIDNDIYHRARPTIGVKQKLLPLNGALGFNPAMTAMKDLYDQGCLAVVNGCGYPNPNRSHFESMAIWQTADPTNSTPGGWLGHYLDHVRRGTSVMPAVNIGAELPLALVNDSAPVPSIQAMDEFRVRTDPSSPMNAKMEEQIITDFNALKQETPAMQFLSRQATNAIVASEQIRKLTAGYKPDADYPQNLGQKLKFIAQIISGNFGTKLYYCDIGGFDTHANQVGQQEQLLANIGQSISAFFKDLEAKKIADKVVVMCFSEFGRRVQQNDSGGTDHGAAAPMFVAGKKVQGGLYGQYPSLAELDNGDLKYTTDFRRVYATLLDGWLNSDSSKVLNNRFEPLAFLGNAGSPKGKGGELKNDNNSNPNQGGDNQMMNSMQG